MKKAQITIFVVIGIILIASILLFFFLRSNLLPLSSNNVPEEFISFTQSYSSCLQELSEEAIQILGQKGGRIYFDKQDGSDFIPFGNSLNFLGSEVPYWYYLENNGLEKSNVPTRFEMEQQINRYIEENSDRCEVVLSEFSLQGFSFQRINELTANSRIKDNDVNIRISSPMDVEKVESKARITEYTIEVRTALGKSYDAAKSILDAENEQLFLEERTIDAIFLYEDVPSTKTSLECYPRTWEIDNVERDLKYILENNIPFTKIKGTTQTSSEKYYQIDAGIEEDLQVNFLFIEDPFKIEINGKEEGRLKGDSISQVSPSFIRSFLCLSSYNFVYDVSYPVMINVYDQETNYNFQFPIIVHIKNNSPRETADLDNIEFVEDTEGEVCKYKLAEETVNTFNTDLEPLEDVLVSYQCINSQCEIGKTTKQQEIATLTEKFPQCINGFVIAEKEGYAKSKQQISTNIDNQQVNIFLEPFTELKVDLTLINKFAGERGLRNGETAIITLLNEEKEIAETIIYPSTKEIKLVDGFYNIKIQVFKEKSLFLEEQTIQNCFNVPAKGIGGIFGFEEEKCETFELPSLDLEEILFGGTEFDSYLDVRGNSRINLYAIENDIPEKIEDVNSILIDITTNKNSPLFKIPELS